MIEPSGVGKLSDVMKAVQDAMEEQEVQLNSAVAVVDAAHHGKHEEKASCSRHNALPVSSFHDGSFLLKLKLKYAGNKENVNGLNCRKGQEQRRIAA